MSVEVDNMYPLYYADQCDKCAKLMELFDNIEKQTNRDYWLMTELFVYMHDGKDTCNWS